MNEPCSVDLIKTENGLHLDINFFAKLMGNDTMLKIKQRRLNDGLISLIDVLYPELEKSDENRYKKFSIQVPIPKINIVSQRMDLLIYFFLNL